jgi:hypothetical protein
VIISVEVVNLIVNNNIRINSQTFVVVNERESGNHRSKDITQFRVCRHPISLRPFPVPLKGVEAEGFLSQIRIGEQNILVEFLV